MLEASVTILVLSLLLGIGAGYWTILSYRRYRLNLLISHELQKIIDKTSQTVAQSKEVVEKSHQIKATPEMSLTGDGEMPELMEQPELMATLITVLVNKMAGRGGTVRLSLQDFMLADEDYVSVYVDTDSQEIILSMDGGLAMENSFIGFGNPDDNTFH